MATQPGAPTPAQPAPGASGAPQYATPSQQPAYQQQAAPTYRPAQQPAQQQAQPYQQPAQQQPQSYQQPAYQQPQVVNVNMPQQQKNSMGTAGFVLALIGFFGSWIPVVGWICWLLGLIFSIIGATKKPKGLATAGLVISLIDIIILIALAGCVASLGAASMF